MCPEAELLSAHFDGEIPEPWKSRLETHLSSCPSCRERLESFAAMRSGMAADSAACGAQSGCERAWERIASDISKRPAKARPASFWARSVSIPLPLAAAALLAAIAVPAVTVAALNGSRPGRALAAAPSPSVGAPGVVQASVLDPSSGGLSIPADASFQDIESLIRFLDSQDLPVTISVELPADRRFGYSGPPEIIKVSDEAGR